MVKTVVFVESLSSLFIAFRDGKKAEKRTLIGNDLSQRGCF